MKGSILSGITGAGALTLVLTGCGPAGDAPAAGSSNTANVTNRVSATGQEPARTAVGSTTNAVSPATDTLMHSLLTQTNQVLQAMARDIGVKLDALAGSIPANDELRSHMELLATTLASDRSAETIGVAGRMCRLALTPEQRQVAKQVRDLASAFVIQRELAEVESVREKLSPVVSSLRDGRPAASLTTLRELIVNGELTPAQRDLLRDIGEEYAPGFKRSTAAVGEVGKLPGTGDAAR